MTLPLWPQQDLGPVRRGDIFALGRHRLACIDATSKADVARLFDGRKPTLVVTSPPYADARDYNDPIPCWDSMMLGALDGHQFADDVQLLVNLGVMIRSGEWVPYWWQWLGAMRERHWSHAGQYVWDKMNPSFGQNHGQCRSQHEYIFHWRKRRVLMNAWVQCRHAGAARAGGNFREKDGKARKLASQGQVNAFRPPSSVFSVHPATGNRTGHPAVSPVNLPAQLIATWKKSECVAYDPFGGSGTLAHAAEEEQVDSLMAEISPAYVQLAIDRWRKMHPDKPVRRLTALVPD